MRPQKAYLTPINSICATQSREGKMVKTKKNKKKAHVCITGIRRDVCIRIMSILLVLAVSH